MGVVRRLDDHRGTAVRRFRNGEGATSIAASLGRSVRWVYKWVARAAETTILHGAASPCPHPRTSASTGRIASRAPVVASQPECARARSAPHRIGGTRG